MKLTIFFKFQLKHNLLISKNGSFSISGLFSGLTADVEVMLMKLMRGQCVCVCV